MSLLDLSWDFADLLVIKQGSAGLQAIALENHHIEITAVSVIRKRSRSSHHG
jgi:hypothetical protein